MIKTKRIIAFLTAALLFAFCLPVFAMAENEPALPSEEEAESSEVVDLTGQEAETDADSAGTADDEATTAAPATEPATESSVDPTNYLVNDAHHAVYRVPDQTYTGKEIQPMPTITYFVRDEYSCVTSRNTLENPKDFLITYKNNTDVGTASFTLSYLECYNVIPEETFTFKIVPRDISESASILPVDTQNYTGKAIEPGLDISVGNAELLEGKDYIIEYSNNTDPGTATAKVTYIGNYKGNAKVEFEISKNAVRGAVVKAIPDQTYTGEEIKPDIEITFDGKNLIEGEDFDVTYSKNTNAGTAIAKITYKGNYYGTKTVTFKILGKDATGSSITNLSDVVYNGSAYEPALKITNNGKELVAGTDYTLKYENNINAGKATVTVLYTGGYSGEDEVHFNIKPLDASKATIATINEQPFAFGRPVTPDALVSLTVDGKTTNLEAGVDYEFEYSNNRKVGKAGIKAVFMGNYTGSVSSSFMIGAVDVSDACIAPIHDQRHTGSPVTPKVKVMIGKMKLKKDRDYTVAYSNNTALGTATATVTFKGNYKGTASTTFNITENGARSIAQTGEIGAAVVGGIAVIAGVTFFIVKKKKKDADED